MNSLFDGINSSSKKDLLKIGLHRFRDHKNVLQVLKNIGYKKPFFKDVRQFIRDTVTNNEEAFIALRDIICIEANHKGKVWFWNGYGEICNGQQFHRSEIIYDLVHIIINTLTYYMLDILYLLWHDDNKGGYPCQKIAHIISF